MPDEHQMQPLPGFAAHVFPAAALRVTVGANQGDPIGEAADCEPGDTYQLRRDAPALRLMLAQGTAAGRERIAAGSEMGREGETVSLIARLTLMAPDGERVEILVLRHDEGRALYALPLSPLAPVTDYTLLAVSDDPGAVRLADIVCISFARGTMITLDGGAQRPIETLAPGDMILTRDHGAQPLRWIGRARLRALGSFAPVVIGAGVLGNRGDLVVSQHHRIFIYQRGRARVGRTAELLVQAKHLVDGEWVWLREGGWADYYSLVFDRHEIVYAEGIPAESLMVTEATLSTLPEEMADEVKARFPGLSQVQHFGTEAGREALDSGMRAALLRGRQRE